ncbi:AAA domain-containing protein [Microbacterium sp. NC79]|uniref:AAA domain-containing protein n=1 Tax=Microbacterium sp. NC79 TaxID=2851009 RepID=UPI001C2C867F|nr:AAA domain-containing protein [Microbacterium sp. NC79]MBV0895966.1 hypothetical protein [Microbacterium sp. NC79]
MRVLFVAEKGTALAVVQRRLDEIGLNPFTLNLHHEGSNSVEVRAALRRSLSASVRPDAVAMANARRRLRNARFELTEYPRALHARNAAGHSAYSAQDELLVLSGGPSISVPLETIVNHGGELSEIRAMFSDLQRYISGAAARAGHPWRFVGRTSTDELDFATLRTLIDEIEKGIKNCANVPPPVRGVIEAAQSPQDLSFLAHAAGLSLPRGSALRAIFDPRWRTASEKAMQQAVRAINDWRPLLHGFTAGVLDLDLQSISSQFEQATASGFIGKKGRQAQAIAPLTAFTPDGKPVPIAAAVEVLKNLLAVRQAAIQIGSLVDSIPGVTGYVPRNLFSEGAFEYPSQRLQYLLTAVRGLSGDDAWSAQVRELLEQEDLAAHRLLLEQMSRAWSGWFKELEVSDDDLRTWLNGDPLLNAAQRSLPDWHRDADISRFLDLQQWIALTRQVEPMRIAGLADARTAILNGTYPAAEVEISLARGIAEASLEERIQTAKLDRFSGSSHDAHIDTYVAAQQDMRQQWAVESPAALLSKRGGQGRGMSTGGLARELEKTTRRLGTRAILSKFGGAVQELTPLVLASPSSVVDLIDPETMDFDVVIFDEASQITVPEAIGSLGRGRAAIIVGDSKQMPPSRRVGTGAADDEIDDALVDEILEDQESILSECELARVPTLSLSWHYRSQDEQLINFSNQKYYRGELSSFPTPTLLSAETGLELRRVAFPETELLTEAKGYLTKPIGFIDGQYLRSGSTPVELPGGIRAGANTNPAEAYAVVDAVRSLVGESVSKLPSIGIVTFNEPQRELIEELLLSADHRGIADAMNESKMGASDVLFVKALEQVQGDERDTIIFSVAFSKQANGKIPTNFGPLSNNGGERRLNVAVTRARRKNIIFCSFDPVDLDVSGSAFDGPKHFKDFLTQATHGSRTPADTDSRVAIRDRHRDSIAAALEQRGLVVRTDVGMSNFRLDLVLSRQAAPDVPILPVLLDGEGWMSRATVSDRDVLPVEVLVGIMGWPRIARIWWPMWQQNQELVITKILEEMDAAEASAQLPPPTDTAADSPSPVGPDSIQVPIRLKVGKEFVAEERATSTEEPPTPREASPVRSPNVALVASPVAMKGAEAALAFTSADMTPVGPRATLDSLDTPANAAAVRSQLVDVIEVEGPVELNRLIRIVARRFDLGAVRAARVAEIRKLIPRGHLKRDKLGEFAWPKGIDPKLWNDFRAANGEAIRSMEEISPQEIANAMRATLVDSPFADQEATMRATAALFGIVRLGANVRARLEAVYSNLNSSYAIYRE